MDPSASLGSFVDKWRARWPEWRVAMAFVPAARRDGVAAWFALLQELTEAAWGGDDPTPGLAKLAWWHEELMGWSKGARRHPLGTALQAQPAPWDGLARSLSSLQAGRMRPGEAVAGDVLAPFATAVAACESSLFGDGGSTDAPGAIPLVEASLLAEQALFHGGTAAARPDGTSRGREAARPRRIHAALVHAAVDDARGLHRSTPLSPWRTLWLAWRAAREP
ncbi:phytoene/squalene synthase family protein [Luteimonas vadosa]|uniref:Phytoene synthase n=1 Tax=Luteimonas vadosa TaxID=1165507 RepID=A0ABP9E5E1_9GAMM